MGAAGRSTLTSERWDARPRSWSDPWVRLALAAAAAAGSGLLVAALMPRGPVTGAQAVTLIGVALFTGCLAGVAWRSRWALLAAPVLHLLAFELGRWGASGPTVDAPRFDSVYGVLAQVLGRGVYGILAVVPMLIGVAYGLAWARRAAERAAGNGHRPWGAGGVTLALATMAVAAVAILLLRPGSTPPIVDADGVPVAGSIASLEPLRIGGHDLWVSMRGHDTENPVLLYVSGGPGQSDLPYARTLFSDLERDFVVVSFDQRGTGKAYPALEPISSLTLASAVSDAIALSEYLAQRFDEERIYLLGESWGTLLGVLAAKERPDLYHAFIGSGQMVNVRETDQRLYRDVLDLAERTDDARLGATMRAYGEPPYGDFFANALVFQHYEALYRPYTPPAAYIERGTTAGIGPWGVLASEYGWIDKVNVLRGLMDMFAVLYPQIQDVDLMRDAAALEVPVYLLDGEAELAARRDPALAWFEALDAPIKRRFAFEDAAHSVAFEQFEALRTILTETVLPEVAVP